MKKQLNKVAAKYYTPTPKKWRKIGDAIQDIGIVIGSITAFTASPWVSVIAIAIGRIGKIITNFNE